MRPTVAEIDISALLDNLHVLRRVAGSADILAVVKANAYGHGAVECSLRLQEAGVNWFAVATLDEAIELRAAGVTSRILVFGGCWPGEEAAFVEFRLTPAVFTFAQAKRLDAASGAAGQRIKVHLKFDTGMGRVGFRYEAAERLAREFSALRNIGIEGIFSHFASAENPTERDFTRLQNERLDEIVDAFRRIGITPEFIDIANSPGTLLYPESRRSLVRIGGLLYGFADDILPSNDLNPGVRPVMSIRTKVAQIKTVPDGETVGYGRTFKAKGNRLIATLPIGYADGLPRGLSNNGAVLINEIEAPIVGRISMDWTTIDVSDAGVVDEGTDVTIIGRDKNSEIRVEDISRRMNTISYEITCGISNRVPRVYRY